MNELVQRLSEREHPVEVSLRPSKTVAAFKECLERNYVHLKFTDTKGGTELGIELASEALDLDKADFETQTGKIHLEGNLMLNYVEVRCIADIDLESLEGTGQLVPIKPISEPVK